MSIVNLIHNWRQTYARNTTYHRRRALRALLRAVGRPDLADITPCVPGYKHRERIASPEEFAKLAACAKPWMRVWLTLTSVLCLRQSEVHILQPQHYHPDTSTVHIFQPKTGEIKILPATPELAAVFQNAPAHPDPAASVVRRYKGGACNQKSLGYHWRKLCRRAGVPPDLTLHDIRRTSGTLAYDITHDLRAVQAMLGHLSMLSSVAYIAHHDKSNLLPLLEALQRPVPKGVQ